MNLNQAAFESGRSRYLADTDKAQFAARLDAIRDAVMRDLGQRDADYVYRVRNLVRYSEITGRTLLMLAGRHPVGWLLGTGALSISKIVENMELGHNVMHGQYDWMNDPALHGASYEWDNVCAGPDWKRTHNFEHHTYTNVLGRDRDIGYGLLRVTGEQRWQWDDLFNLPKALLLALFFEWGVGLHGLHLTEKKAVEHAVTKDKAGKKSGSQSGSRRHFWPFFSKVTRQLAKDYLVFPASAALISRQNVLPVLAGNLAANHIRNIWAFAIIFCGHFAEDVEIFPDNIEQESRADWYLRQIKGSCNIDGGPLMHFFSGNLSHQIEHHLFPDMPANRYREIAPAVRALCQEYGQHYDTGSFTSQLRQVFRRLARYSLPAG